MAGYPWFKVRARDLFIAAPGCTLSIGDPVRFEKIMATALPALRAFIEDGAKDAVIQEIEHPDIILWAIWAIQQYAKEQGADKAKECITISSKKRLTYIINQKHPSMKVRTADCSMLKGAAIKLSRG